MTEAEWLAATDPTPMLKFLRGKASDRKLRLFAVACCRMVWNLNTDKGNSTVGIAEQYADGLVDRKALSAAMRAVAGAARRAGYGSPQAIARDAALMSATDAARCVSVQERSKPEIQVHFLFEIIGNPFRSIAGDPTWLTPNVRLLAEGIYSERAFDRLPILADALMDAGCDNADILGHCRSNGPHVRGCWVVDLLLQKG